MKSNTCLFLVAFSALFSACQKDDTVSNIAPQEAVRSYANVPNQLWDYFERFEEEALQRGYLIDLNQQNITAEILEISEDGIAGTCSFSSHQPNHIVIDKTFFNQTSDLFKEMVIFHELGHCVLYRGHRETADHNGNCVSIMRSGVEGCRDNYRVATRAAYMDELFDLSN